jgi:hypothetical protein
VYWVQDNTPKCETAGASSIMRTELFQRVAREVGRDSSLVDINVFFGNDSRIPCRLESRQRTATEPCRRRVYIAA